MQADLRELEDLIARLAGLHGRLADLLADQRQALRRANATAIAESGGRIERLVEQIGQEDRQRRALCGRLADRLGLGDRPGAPGGQPVRMTVLLEELSAAGQRTEGLRLVTAGLREQMVRVQRAGRVNQSAAGRLADLCGEFFKRLARLGRETGCYDRRGRKALTTESGAAAGFSALA